MNHWEEKEEEDSLLRILQNLCLSEAERPDELDDRLIGHENSCPKYTNGGRRELCSRCERPKLTTCICAALPVLRGIQLQKCHVVVLQHPLELERKNRSLPIVELSLHPSSLTLAVGRGGRGSSIQELIQRIPSGVPFNQVIWLMFPGPDAISLSKALEQVSKDDFVTLFFLDATWQFAREMDRSLKRHLVQQQQPQQGNQHQELESGGSDILDFRRVCFNLSEDLDLLNQYDNNGFIPRRFDIRKPPSEEQLCTAEAISRVVAVIEGRPEIHSAIMNPLDLMVTKWRNMLSQNHVDPGGPNIAEKTC